MKVGHLSIAYYLCMDTVPKKVRCMEVIENEREMGGGGGSDGGRGVHHLSWKGGRGFFSFLKVRGQIYLFPWKLQ